MEGVEGRRLADGVFAAENQRRLASDGGADVLELEPVGVRGLDADLLGARLGPAQLDAGLLDRERLRNEDAAVRADQLQAHAARIDETAVEYADNLLLERQRSREDDDDAARPGDLVSPAAHRLAADQPERGDPVRPDGH